MKTKIVDEINKAGGYKEWVKKKPNLFDIPESDFLDLFNKAKLLPKKVLAAEIMIQASLKMIPFLIERNWSFFVPENTTDSFVTSDHPVVLHNEDFEPDMIPGMAMKKTDFVFPVNPKLCLIASFASEELYIPASRDFVIGINRLIANKSYKYVFRSNNDFTGLFGKGAPYQ